MIKSFRNRETRDLFERKGSRRLPSDIVAVALRKLVALHSAVVLEDLAVPPGNRLEGLRGDRAGKYSIRINKRWRLCFLWKGSDAYEVELVDYH